MTKLFFPFFLIITLFIFLGGCQNPDITDFDLTKNDVDSLTKGDKITSFQPLVWDWHARGGWARNWKVLTGDFNGDGKTDMAYNYTDGSGNRSAVALSAGNGSFYPLVWDWHARGGWAIDWTVLTGDFNGDGKTDLLYNYTDGSGNRSAVALSAGNGSFNSLVWDWHAGGGWARDWKVLTGDYNGDGKTDLAYNYTDGSGNRTYVALSIGNGSFYSLVLDWHARGGWARDWKVRTGDFNKDGKTDLLYNYTDGSGNRSAMALSAGNGSFHSLVWDWHARGGWAKDWKVLTGDFNGDGKTDLLYNYTDGSGNRSAVALSAGNGSFNSLVWDWHAGGGWATDWNVLTGDLDNDGKTDIVYNYTDGSGNRSAVALSAGNGSFHPLVWNWHARGGWARDWKVFTGDFNNDGKIDIVYNYTDGSGNRSAVALTN